MPPVLTPNAWLRWDIIRRELDRLPATARILEIGTGGGAVGTRLSRHHAYVGIEPDESSRRRAEVRLGASVPVLEDLDRCAPDEMFDVVCAFEVLEHIDDDVGALTEWVQHLRPGGEVWISVPAHQERFDAADEIAGHLRRYSRDQLTALLQAAGLDPVRIDSIGFPVGNLLETGRNVVARRRLREAGTVAERTASSGRFLQPPDALAVPIAILIAPARLLQRPFRRGERGPGWVAVARRPPG
jgi:SAM-dependent methyltransferase